MNIGALKNFWPIIEKVGWGREHTDCDRGKDILMNALPTVEAAETFHKVKSSVYAHLYDTITEWEQDTGKSCEQGDDGFSDLINHIIGLGEEEVRNVLNDPSLAFRRAHAPYGSSEGFTESFAYCVPYKDDYLDPLTKLERKKQSLESWLKDLRADVSKYEKGIDRIREKIREVEGQLSEVQGTIELHLTNS